MKKATIRTIAETSGLSTATVDRVLNDRPGVSAAARHKILSTARDLGYLPEADNTPLPAHPAKLEFLMPIGTNSFLRELAGQIEEFCERLPLVASVRVHQLRGLDPADLEEAAARLSPGTSGIGVVATDHPRTRELLKDIAQSGTRVVTIASDVPSIPRAAYVGVDNVAAGRVAGLLIGRAVIRTNYYVTAHGGTVAIMRGVQGSILGVPLQEPYLLGCLDRPSSGTLHLAGEEVEGLDGDALASIRNRRIGFVFQQFNLLPRTSALDNVALPMVYAGIKPAERRTRALAALQRVGLGERAMHTPAELSGGQQQRVAIARALVNQPSLILADEPTGALDTQTSEDIMRLLAELNAQGMTIVMVTHEADIALWAGRRIVFRDGRIVEDRRQVPRAAAAVPA